MHERKSCAEQKDGLPVTDGDSQGIERGFQIECPGSIFGHYAKEIETPGISVTR